MYVHFEGDSKKSRMIYDANVFELSEILEEVDSSKHHILFLDGYVLNGPKHIDVQHATSGCKKTEKNEDWLWCVQCRFATK
jgi:hypothetical protein